MNFLYLIRKRPLEGRKCINAQQAHDIKMTSYWRLCDVITSHIRQYNVVTTSCACWVGCSTVAAQSGLCGMVKCLEVTTCTLSFAGENIMYSPEKDAVYSFMRTTDVFHLIYAFHCICFLMLCQHLILYGMQRCKKLFYEETYHFECLIFSD